MSGDASGAFAGKVVLVTGVGRAGQIGNAVALAFGRAGARIVACDRNAVGVAERVREFAGQGIDARPAAGDLTQPDVAALAVEIALRHFGQLDVVVNVAGGLTTYGPVEKATIADFDREIAINVKTTFLMSQAAIEPLARTRGAIVNFASIAYFEPSAQLVVYSAAKAAVAGLTQSLAAELRDRRIRVNAIAPSMVRTAENVASAGPESDGITGQIVPIAGPR
jgi:NAD(P)-dependent dehydrogenase (short-subunit alcohol dehydrogenase family)